MKKIDHIMILFNDWLLFNFLKMDLFFDFMYLLKSV